MASLLFWGTKYIRKGKFFCSFELLLRRSYIMKECKVSVWNKVKEVDVKQDNLKKSEGKKKPKRSLHQDSEVVQKGRNKKKKGKLKPRRETDSRNPTEGTKREKKQMPLRKLWQKEKKNEESYLVRAPGGNTGRGGQTYFVLVLAGQFEHTWKKLKQKGTKNKKWLLVGLRIWRRSQNSIDKQKTNPTKNTSVPLLPRRGTSEVFS